MPAHVPVMVWDEGTYAAQTKHPAKDLEGGKLHFVLSGKKLSGEWYLVRLREENQWLIIRGGPDHAVIPKQRLDASVLSGKSPGQIAEGKDSKRKPNPKPKLEPKPASTRVARRTANRAAPLNAAAVKADLVPMMAQLVEYPPEGEWEFEIKFDGFRALARRDAAGNALFSRTAKDFTAKFPEVAGAIDDLKISQAVIDGEVVALDPEGRSSFALLQAFEQGTERPPIYFYAFDLLELNGASLLEQALERRKAQLKKLIPTGTSVSTPVTWEEVEAAAAENDPDQLVFTVPDVLDRVARLGDLFAPALTTEQKLPALSRLT